MSRTRTGALLGTVLVAVAVLFGSCIPPGVVPQKKATVREPRLVLTVMDPCRLVDHYGKDVEKVIAEPGDDVLWANASKNPAVIQFNSLDIVGRWDILLNPGESYLTQVRTPMGTAKYKCMVFCKEKGKAPHRGPTPPIEQTPPN